MLEQHLGEDEFRAGIASYLSTHAYGNTETTDLWDALAAATGQPVRRIADSWIFQGGHPLVSVRRGDDPKSLVLSQRIFRYLGTDDGSTWSIPIGLRWADASGAVHDQDVLLEATETTVTLDGEPTWVVANRGAAGFYRTDYAPDLRAALAEVALDELDPTERYTLVDDTWAAVLGGATPAEEVVDLVRALSTDQDLAVWRRISAVLVTLHRVAFGDDAASRAVATLIQEVVGPLHERLGTRSASGEPDSVTNLRATAFELLGIYTDSPSLREQATAIVDRALDGSTGDQDDPSLIDAAVRVVAERADDATFDRFLAASQRAATPQDKLRYLGALADAKDPEVFGRFLDLLLSGEVRTQDIGSLLNRGLVNTPNAATMWQYAAEHWDTLVERLPTNAISRMVTGVRTFTDAALAAEVARFLEAHVVPQAAKAFAQHIERMQVTVALAERERDRLAGSMPR
jgi:puromycin-sensitive aminopeptidase